LTCWTCSAHDAPRGSASGDDQDGRAHEEQGDTEVQDEVPGAKLGGFIVVSALTDSSEDDGSVGVDLLGRLGAPVASFRADGAYDTRAV
jgi:hypothetical protein